MSERVVMAMSGGVDSSLAAALLVEKGFEVVGVTLHLAGEASRCCSLQDAEDAHRVAERLGIRLYVANYTEAFRREVIEPFADAYRAGRTPNPCVTCNRRFKFDVLLQRARALGARWLATGHFARIDRDPISGRRRLRCALDARKDQSYFLFDLDQTCLARILFPVGELTKLEVREHARALGLPTADKPESQEICFVPEGDYARVVEAVRPDAPLGPGEISDEAGRVLGRHAGIHHFTVGQRRGLGIAAERPLFVKALDVRANRVIVAEREALQTLRAELEGVRWLAGAPPAGVVPARIRIRYRHAGVHGRIVPGPKGSATVHFDEPVTALAPGQVAVFYDDDVVLGGGWIRGGEA